MAYKSEIAWTDATWNPFRGCTRVSPGCQNCYAERMAARGLPGLNSPTTGKPFAVVMPSGPRWTNQVELIENQMDAPLKWRKPRRIFVNSMSDTFHRQFPNEAVERIFRVMYDVPRHTFILLTKRADRMRDLLCRSAWWTGTWSEARKHIHIGISAEDQQRFDERIEDLRSTPAAVRWLSLGPIDLTGKLAGIHWVVVGGESGPGARPCDVAWIRQIVRQCREAGTPCFVKQLGACPVVQVCRQHHYDFGDAIGRKARFSTVDKRFPSSELWRFHFKDPKGGHPAEWPTDLRVREYPQ